jgi:putative ABC transport system permease protein
MAARIAVRDLRGSRFKFAFVIAAIGVGVAALGGTAGCIAAFEAALSSNLREWIAADVSIRSQNAPEDDQAALLASLEHRGAKQTMVIDAIAQVNSDSVPPDSVAVTEDLLGRMNVAAGSSILVNGVRLRIAAILVSEPDQLAELPTPLPRILVHVGGRAGEALRPRGMYYRTLLALPPGMAVDPVRVALDRVFPGRRILDYRTPDPQILWFLQRAATGLKSIGVFLLLLAALGAAVAMWSHIEPRLDSLAVMKVLGGRSRDTVLVFVVEMAILALAGCVLGTAGGLAAERFAARVVPQQFGLSIATPWNWTVPANAALAGFAAALLLPLPVLLAAVRVRPSRLLRRAMPEVENLGARVRKLRAIARGSGRLRFSLRHGIGNIVRPGSHARLVLGALTAAVVLLFAMHSIKQSLLTDLTENLRPDSSALFLAGILPHQIEDVKRALAAQEGAEPPVIAPFFPIGILSVDEHAPKVKESDSEWLQRRWLSTRLDRSASFAHVVEGSWPPPSEGLSERLEVLLPQRLAHALGARVGSRVQFDAGGVTIEARVAALARLAPLDSFRCCLIFNRALPDQHRSVYYGVASLRPGGVAAARVALYRAFPSITTWNAGDAARMLETWLDGMFWTLRMVAIFALITGTAILGFAVAATQRRRVREIAILKSLGASRSRALSIYVIEFSAMGCISGMAGVLIASITVNLLWGRVIGGAVALPHWNAFLETILATVVLANLGGWAATIPYFRRRPSVLVREE